MRCLRRLAGPLSARGLAPRSRLRGDRFRLVLRFSREGGWLLRQTSLVPLRRRANVLRNPRQLSAPASMLRPEAARLQLRNFDPGWTIHPAWAWTVPRVMERERGRGWPGSKSGCWYPAEA